MVRDGARGLLLTAELLPRGRGDIFQYKKLSCISCKRKPALRALSGFAAHIQCAAKQPEWYRVGRLSCISLVFGSAVNAAFERGFFMN